MEAMLLDTGEDDGLEVAPLPRHVIGARELSHALDRKYHALRSKALWEMLKAGSGMLSLCTQSYFRTLI